MGIPAEMLGKILEYVVGDGLCVTTARTTKQGTLKNVFATPWMGALQTSKHLNSHVAVILAQVKPRIRAVGILYMHQHNAAVSLNEQVKGYKVVPKPSSQWRDNESWLVYAVWYKTADGPTMDWRYSDRCSVDVENGIIFISGNGMLHDGVRDLFRAFASSNLSVSAPADLNDSESNHLSVPAPSDLDDSESIDQGVSAPVGQDSLDQPDPLSFNPSTFAAFTSSGLSAEQAQWQDQWNSMDSLI